MWQKSNIIKKDNYQYSPIPVILNPNNTYAWDSGTRVPFNNNKSKENKITKH